MPSDHTTNAPGKGRRCVDVVATSRHVRVPVDGTLLAASASASGYRDGLAAELPPHPRRAHTSAVSRRRPTGRPS